MPAGWWIEVDNVVVVAQPFALVFLRILRLLEHLVDARLNGILLARTVTRASERAVVEVTEREQVLKETLIYLLLVCANTYVLCFQCTARRYAIAPQQHSISITSAKNASASEPTTANATSPHVSQSSLVAFV